MVPETVADAALGAVTAEPGLSDVPHAAAARQSITNDDARRR
jgi:hypothetical protein